MIDQAAQQQKFAKITQRSLRVHQQALQKNRYVHPSDAEQALHSLSYGFKYPSVWPDTSGLMLGLAPHVERLGLQLDIWPTYLADGIAHSQAIADRYSLAHLLQAQGLIYQQAAEYESAIERYQRSQELFAQINEAAAQADTLIRLAQIRRYQRRFDEALDLTTQAATHLPADHPVQVEVLVLQGTLALDTRDWEQAIELFKQALQQNEAYGDLRMKGRILMSMGVGYEKNGDYEEAITVCKQAIEHFNSINDMLHKARTLMNMANVYVAQTRLNEAITLYQQASLIFIEQNDLVNQAHVGTNKGVTYCKLGKFELSKTNFYVSADLWYKVGNLERWINAISGVSDVFIAKRDFKDAESILFIALARLENLREIDQSSYAFWHKILQRDLALVQENLATIS